MRFRKYIIGIWLCVFGTSLSYCNSIKLNCPTFFADIFAAAENGDALKEFTAIYNNLLDHLGGDIKLEQLKAMSASDPFVLPPDLMLSSNTLADSLSDMKTLVLELGLSEVEVKAELIANLKRRLESIRTLEQRSEQIHSEEIYYPVIEFFGEKGVIRWSRDGKIFYHLLREDSEGNSEFEFFNTHSEPIRHHIDIPRIADLVVDDNGKAFILNNEGLYQMKLLRESGRFDVHAKPTLLKKFSDEFKGEFKNDRLYFVQGADLLLRLKGETGLLIEGQTGDYQLFDWRAVYSDTFFSLDNNQVLAAKKLGDSEVSETLLISLYDRSLKKETDRAQMLVKEVATNPRTNPVRFFRGERSNEVLALAIQKNGSPVSWDSLNLIRLDLLTKEADKLPLKGVLSNRTRQEIFPVYFDGIYPLSKSQNALLTARQKNEHKFFLLDTWTQESREIRLREHVLRNEFAKDLISRVEDWTDVIYAMVPNTNVLILRNAKGTLYFRMDLTEFLKANE